MKHKEIITQLMAEVSKYILESEPSRLVISLHQETDGLHLVVLDNILRDAEELQKVEKYLNPVYRPELAEYYGSMAETDVLGTSRLGLIGWQIKHAEVSRTEEGTKIDMFIGSENFEPNTKKGRAD